MKRIINFMLVTVFLLVSPAIYAQQTFEEELGKIIVTATRIAQHDYKITGNITVIDRDQIEESNAQTLPDILNEALGVFVRNQGTIKTAKSRRFYEKPSIKKRAKSKAAKKRAGKQMRMAKTQRTARKRG